MTEQEIYVRRIMLEKTKTTVSEIVLPSFERMDDCYALEVI